MRVSVIVYSFILLAVFKNTSGEKGHEKIERKVFFGDLRDGKRFRGERLLSKSVASGTMCAMKCIRNPKCRSFNFCNSGMVCELNRHDLFSTQYGAKMLDSAPNCLYAGMRKSYIPECYYNGMKSDISNDQDPNNCEIIHKRVDFEWSVWGELTVENSDTLLKKYYTREKLIEAAHGGKTGSTLEGSVKVIYWLNFVHELKTWQNAKRRCTDMDGKLFFKVDGTKEQLEVFTEKMGYKSHWLGIFTEDHTSWKSVDGSGIPNNMLVWQEGEPNNGYNREKYVLNGWNGNWGLNDVKEELTHYFICDMIP